MLRCPSLSLFRWWLLIFGCLLVSIPLTVGYAQVTTNITRDGTLRTSVAAPVMELTGNRYNITGGTRPGDGPNLFHSFRQFSVGSNDIANFSNDSGLATDNILSRVTGGQVSEIFGTLRTTGFGNANLFLMNPAGMVFGPDASLDVPGSFNASTADYISLADGGRFAADLTDPANAMLTMANPTTFGFLDNVRPITLTDTTLEVAAGESLSLVGGDINLTGSTLQAPGGRINVASIASQGEVILKDTEDVLKGSGIDVSGISRFGDIDLMSSAIDVGGEGGGVVYIRSGEFVMQKHMGSLLPMPSSSSITADTTGNKEGIGISIQANTVALTEQSSISSSSRFGASAAGGTVLIEAKELTVQDSKIASETFSVVPGRMVIVRGPGDSNDLVMTLLGTFNDLDSKRGSGLSARTTGTGGGKAGNILVQAKNVTLKEGGRIASSSLGRGNAGTVTIEATGAVTASGKSSVTDEPSGISAQASSAFNRPMPLAFRAGRVEVTANTVTLSDGAEIVTESDGSATGGSITVDATTEIKLEEGSRISARVADVNLDLDPANIRLTAPKLTIADGRVTAETTGSRNAGTITLEVDNVVLTGDAEVASDVEDGAGGAGGNLTIEARTITLQDVGDEAPEISSDTEGSGKAGDVTLTASEAIRLLNRTTGGDEPGIFANSKGVGTGNAGNIIISTPVLELIGSTIRTSSEESAGGNINVQARDLVYLLNSNISASANGVTATDGGGNVTIDPTFVVLNNSTITAQANAGNGGIIDITTDFFIIDRPLADVLNATSTGGGANGEVIIQSPNQDVTAAVTILDASFLDVSGLLRERCAAAAVRERSSFTVASKGGVPRAPNAYFPSALQDIRSPVQLGQHDQQPIRLSQADLTPRIPLKELGCR